jgi:hypothetical protein
MAFTAEENIDKPQICNKICNEVKVNFGIKLLVTCIEPKGVLLCSKIWILMQKKSQKLGVVHIHWSCVKNNRLHSIRSLKKL